MTMLFSVFANHQIKHQDTLNVGCQPGACRWQLIFLRDVFGYVWVDVLSLFPGEYFDYCISSLMCSAHGSKIIQTHFSVLKILVFTQSFTSVVSSFNIFFSSLSQWIYSSLKESEAEWRWMKWHFIISFILGTLESILTEPVCKVLFITSMFFLIILH